MCQKMASLFQPHYMRISTFIRTPFIPLDHHKRLSCYNNSSVYRSGISDMLWINSRLLDVFIQVFRIMQNLGFFVFFSFGMGETEEISISNAPCLEKGPSKCKPSTADPVLSSPVCQETNSAGEWMQTITHSLCQCSVWWITTQLQPGNCSHISVARCPLKLAWLINSDTALYCAMRSGWWAPKSMLTSSTNTRLSITISVVTPGT